MEKEDRANSTDVKVTNMDLDGFLSTPRLSIQVDCLKGPPPAPYPHLFHIEIFTLSLL